MSGGKTSALGKEVSGRYVLLPLSKRALYSEFCGHPYLFLLKYSLNEPTLCQTKMPSSGSLGRRVQLFAARFLTCFIFRFVSSPLLGTCNLCFDCFASEVGSFGSRSLRFSESGTRF